MLLQNVHGGISLDYELLLAFIDNRSVRLIFDVRLQKSMFRFFARSCKLADMFVQRPSAYA